MQILHSLTKEGGEAVPKPTNTTYLGQSVCVQGGRRRSSSRPRPAIAPPARDPHSESKPSRNWIPGPSGHVVSPDSITCKPSSPPIGPCQNLKWHLGLLAHQDSSAIQGWKWVKNRFHITNIRKYQRGEGIEGGGLVLKISSIRFIVKFLWLPVPPLIPPEREVL